MHLMFLTYSTQLVLTISYPSPLLKRPLPAHLRAVRVETPPVVRNGEEANVLDTYASFCEPTVGDLRVDTGENA